MTKDNDCNCPDCDCSDISTTHCHHTCNWVKQFDYSSETLQKEGSP